MRFFEHAAGKQRFRGRGRIPHDNRRPGFAKQLAAPRLLVTWVVVFLVAALALKAMDGGGLGMALGSIGMWLVAGILETINFASVRPRWARALEAAPRTGAPAITFAPAVYSLHNPGYSITAHIFGIGGSF
jgi:hypothetical protein